MASAAASSLIRSICGYSSVPASIKAYPYEGSGTPDDPFVVVWIPGDPQNPLLYSKSRNWVISILVALECFAVAFCSSAYTGAAEEIILHFNCSREVFVLGLSVFVLGFGLGPLVWGPLSELYGRQVIFVLTYAGLVAFNGGAVASQNVWTLIILRFFAGSIGSASVNNTGAVISDIWNAQERGLALAVYSLSPWMGPTLGPLVGGFVSETVGWRWVLGVLTIFTGVVLVLGTFLVPETYAPVLLRRRAKLLSKLTGKTYKSRIDIDEAKKASPKEMMKTSLQRPWVLLFEEPIVLILSVYMAILYGVLYMCFGAFPIVYQEKRGWSAGVGGLSFLGVLTGMWLGVFPASVFFNLRYVKTTKDLRGPAPPESRLPACMLGAVAVPVGLFWSAWTNAPSIHWSVSIIASSFFGFGLVLIFLSAIGYLIDAYTMYAASVLAAASVMRSVFGAVFPLFTTQMFDNLGIHWAASIPAFLSLACLPFPFLFYKYGGAIRQRCKYAAESAAFMEQLHNSSRQESAYDSDDKKWEEDAQADCREPSTTP